MDFEKELKAKKLKVTPQRLAILREIEASGHISIEDIHDRIKKSHPSTSLATVYKNVATLCSASILQEVKAPGCKQRFELNQERHVHVMCEICGKLEDLHVDFSSLQLQCMKLSGYNLYNISAVFLGTCPHCIREPKLGRAVSKQIEPNTVI